MITLFIDTSYNQILGILDEKNTWVKIHHNEGQRNSSQLHVDLNRIFSEANLSPSQITNVFYVAGPGFYTGLRMAYGLADLLGLEKKKISTIYSFEIPYLLGSQKYFWITKAYRGEIFIHERNYENQSTYLLTEDAFQNKELNEQVFIHHSNALDDKLKNKIQNSIDTEKLMIENIKTLFEKSIQSTEIKDLFYFRPPEEEFRPSL
ncbi:MAG: hypothetical protein K2P81_15910 [Bacteriovoracaceae bacterium]|nr:hypothetical protein [Bacteriovoracaceae bacterium]